MPKNKFQDVIYTIIMASVMVYGMVAYNIVLNTGSMQNWVFLAVFHEWPIMTVIAILLELVFVGKLAMKVAFRLVNPREASQTRIMLAISAASVWCAAFSVCCSGRTQTSPLRRRWSRFRVNLLTYA